MIAVIGIAILMFLKWPFFFDLIKEVLDYPWLDDVSNWWA
jgi:hypothetical protein